MKNLCFIVCCLLLSISKSQTITRLLAVSPFDDNLVILDTANFTTVSTKTMNFSAGAFQGLNGLARKPNTGVFYAVVNNGSGVRYLATLNPITASLTSIGVLGDNFSQLTFNGNNTLLGVTGLGATVPCSVYRINTANASKSLIGAVTSGYGQVICYNPIDNKIYHWYSGTPLMNSYDTSFVNTNTITNYSGGNETIGGVYKTGNVFVTHDWNGDFRTTRANGSSTVSAVNTSHYFKGLAYITCSRSITPSSQLVCGSSSSVTLVMSGTTGATYQWFRNGSAISGATLSTFNTSLTGSGYYKCRIEDGCGMDTLAPGVTLTLAPLPIVSISGPTLACSAAQITLTGTSGGTSQWYLNGVLIPGATSNTFMPTNAGKYNMTKTNTNGCKDSAAVGLTLTFANSPTVTAVGGKICSGKSFTISASGATSYSYSGGNVVSPTVTSTYSVTGTGTNGCVSAPALVTVTVDAGPNLTINASSTLVCADASVSLTAVGAQSYTWTNGVMNGIGFTPSVSATYSVTGTGSNGCESTAAISLSVTNCTSVLNLNTTNKLIDIIPNPNHGNARIRSNSFTEIRVFNELGQVILWSELNELNHFELELKNLSKGLYFILLNDNNKSQTYKMLVH